MAKLPRVRATHQQLRAFEATARLLSVTRAAEELHLTQPTVSIQLRELADTIGMPLFEHHGRQIRLTEAGLEVQDTVREVFASWSRLESRLAELQGLQRGTLRLAAVTTAEYLLPQLLGPFCARHPGVEVELAVENRDTIVSRLEKSLDDLTLMTLPPEHLRLRRLPFTDNPLVVLAQHRHPLRGRRITLAELAGERWLLREKGSGGRSLVEAHFEQQGFRPPIAMALGSNEAIKHAVAGGLGITVLSRHTLGPDGEAQGLAQLDVEGFPLPSRFDFVMREERRLSPVARAFLDFVQEGLPPVGGAPA